MAQRSRKTRSSISITPISVGPREAAAMLGVSRDHLDRHIQHELRWIRKGRRKMVLVDDLRAWAEANAARTLS